MQSYFAIRHGKVVSSTASDATIRVFTAPTEEEKQQIIKRLNVDSFDLAAAIDPDEISRVEFEKQHVSIIWKQPHTGTFSLKVQFDVLSLGFFIHQGILIIVTREDTLPFSEKIFEGVRTVNDVLLRYFFYTAKQYLSHLKAIKQAKTKLETKLSQSMENKYFLQMFDISESLVYYLDAIESNGAVLSKLLANPDKLKLTSSQIHFLEDTISENNQSSKQAQIYSAVLSGLMDARGNVINNNMNVLLKNLTLINVVFLPLNLIASMGGMSEYSFILNEYHINWRIGYFIFSLAMLALGWIIWISLKRYFGSDRNQEMLSQTE